MKKLFALKPMLSAVFASITGLWKRKVYCNHLFRAKDMQTRDENGMVKWNCCKCNKLFVEPYGLKILENGTCDGKWGRENLT